MAMNPSENFYEILGLARSATDMEIAQSYRTLAQKLQSENSPDGGVPSEQRMRQLDMAYQTLLNPADRKKHDEKIAWLVARNKLDAEKARQFETQRKVQQEASKEAALEDGRRADEAALQAIEDAKRQDALMRIHSESDERFRRLRQERLQAGYGDTLAQEAGDAGGANSPASSPAEPTVAQAIPSTGSIGKITILGSVAAVGALFLVLLGFQPGKAKPTLLPTPSASATMPAVEAAVAPVAPQVTPVEPTPAQPKPKSRASGTPVPKPPLRKESVKADAAKTAAHEAAMQELIRRGIERQKLQNEKPLQPASPAVPDPGGHTGFDPKCRWISAQEWSCK